MKRHQIAWLLSFILWITGPAPLNATEVKPTSSSVQSGTFGRPFLRKFNDNDGLPVNSVMSLERDLRGNLWAGTQDGAAYFNGHEWRSVSLPNRSVSSYVFSVLATKDGAVWFGTDGGGLHRFAEGEWKTFDTGSGLLSNAIRCLYETFDENGKSIIWIGTRDGMSTFDGSGFLNYDNSNGLPDKRVRAFLQTTDKRLLIATYGGIIVWEGAERKLMRKEDGLPHNTVFSLLESRNSAGESVIWAGTEGGLARLDGDKWTTFAEELPAKGVRSLEKTKDSRGNETVWVGFDGGGLASLESEVWSLITQKEGLPNDLVFAIEDAASPDGSVWISTLGSGISRLERSNWITFNELSGLPNNAVFSLFETSNHTRWFGTFGGGAASFQSSKFSVENVKTGLPSDFVYSFLESTADDGTPVFYIGTEKGLIKRSSDGRNEKIDLTAEKIEEIWSLLETTEKDRSKSLWIGGGGGIVKINKGVKTFYNTSKGLPDNRVRGLLSTPLPVTGEYVLWIATMGGLARLEGDQIRVFDTRNGLPNNRIYTVAEIGDKITKQIWVGTGGGGVAILDPDNLEGPVSVISAENGKLVPANVIYKILQDSSGRIYLTTNKGVARLSADGPIFGKQFKGYTFTTDDGLPSNECIAGAAYLDRLGSIWVGTVGGAATLNVSREFVDNTSDPIDLERVLIDGKERTKFANADLPHTENNLVFEYRLQTSFRENGTQYQTQLVGLETKPVDWSSEPRREFNFLPDGDFTFKVWGKDAAGNVSAPLEIPFRINPAWWRTWWAISFYFLASVGLAVGITYLLYRNRLRRLLELERVRNRIATDLHDDIGASLTRITLLSEVLANSGAEKSEDERRSLSSIAETSRDVTSSMSDIVWAINPKRDNLRDLVQRMRHFASEMLSAKDIDFVFLTPLGEDSRQIDVDLRRQIYLIFKEAVSNCARHGECTEVEIKFNLTDGHYSLLIADNGKGFDETEVSEKETFGGNGLTSMRARAAATGGQLTIVSRPNEGTRLEFRVSERIN